MLLSAARLSNAVSGSKRFKQVLASNSEELWKILWNDDTKHEGILSIPRPNEDKLKEWWNDEPKYKLSRFLYLWRQDSGIRWTAKIWEYLPTKRIYEFKVPELSRRKW